MWYTKYKYLLLLKGDDVLAIPQTNVTKKYTYKDYIQWSSSERWEIINGIPYNMSPAPSRKHQKVSGELYSAIHTYLKGKTCEIYSAPFDVRLPIDNESDDEICTVVQPDITVICDKSKLDDRGCKGTPDFIVEITSPSTFRKDIKEKFDLYEKVGVKEYWIVYPDEKLIVSYKLNSDGKFGRPTVYSEEDRVGISLFEAFNIDLSEVFTEL
jgi:Uma2 family endonuclease